MSKSNSVKGKNPWNKNQRPPANKNQNAARPKPNTQEKFKEAQQKHQAASQKYTKDYESSEEEEELETEDAIVNILKNYNATGAETNLIGRTKGFLEEAFQSGACTCLICISSVKRNEGIWTCSECFCFFHLICIQRWSKDSIFQQKQALEAPIVTRQIKINWGCPKCRHEYLPDDIPSNYLCFCKKTINPPFQPLIIPHSCGETCSKQLQPLCGHNCLLLCHPGPCPPCPQTVQVDCYCGVKKKIQRCSNKEWSCGGDCGKKLSCGKHVCMQGCHSGNCLPCPKKSIQKCVCGSSQKLRDCATPVWQCDKVCVKSLDCGFHKCNEVCHLGSCGTCKLAETRTCPCGKSSYKLPCTEETPACGDTCGKVLECGMHICHQRCHKDKCSPCVETVEKSCRCGLHIKEVQCKKPYLCETKCKQMKDCNKHPCNRKCCDGNCPPCEKPCGRTLTCRKHSCTSVCHQGPCYPCNLTETVKCFCGATSLIVPCGKKRKTRPPKCSKLCKLATDCHHKTALPHKCHFGDCPACKQICNKARKSCPHLCPAYCHSAVLLKIEAQKASTPWEQEGPKVAKKMLPCPDCVVPVPVTCLGEHETLNWPCHMAKPSSCHKPCGRQLPCGNHKCQKPCHLVEGSPDKVKAGENCEECEYGCSKERPDDCPHDCPKPCHPGPCPPCKQMIRITCHCALTQPYIACKDWTTGDKDALQSCGNQCPKLFPCGHQCKSNCHSGICPNSEQCKKKMKVHCSCKRIKKEFSCEVNRRGEAIVQCDELCAEKKLEEKKLKDLQNEKKKREEEERNQRELEMFEKKFQGKKKYKDRRVVEENQDKGFMEKYWVGVVGVFVAFIGVYLVISLR